MDIQTNTQSDTRTNLLDAAMQLMLDKGFTATSVDEICKQAGVTKGSFFTILAAKKNWARSY
ncbi:MAG: TetR/AcrR family transcriptional regulator [Caldilineaceae bacterium]